jgi:hypothetical protein
MIEVVIKPPDPAAVRVDWMWSVSVERVLGNTPDLVCWAAS